MSSATPPRPLQAGGSYRKDGEVCEHHGMVVGDLLHSPFEILIIPVSMILFFAVILIRMYAPGEPVDSKDADRQG
jgi:hypothetical protein